MAYEALTDKELNRKLANLLGLLEVYPKFTENPAITLPLCISLRVALFPCTDKPDSEWYADAIFREEEWSVHLDKNPLKAAVIVLLGLLENV